MFKVSKKLVMVNDEMHSRWSFRPLVLFKGASEKHFDPEIFGPENLGKKGMKLQKLLILENILI